MSKSILEHYTEMVNKSLDRNLYTHTADYARALGNALKQTPIGSDALASPSAQADRVRANTPASRPLAAQPASSLNTANVRPDAGNVDGTYLGGNQYRPSSTFAPIAAVGQGATNSFDVFAIANWARNIAQEFGLVLRPGQTSRAQGLAKGLSFTASQFLLASFNPGDLNVGGRLNQTYNPLSLPLSLVPGVRGATALASPNAAAAASVTGDVYTSADAAGAPDRLLLLRKGVYVKARSATDLLQFTTPTPQHIGEIAGPVKAKFSLPVTVEEQVDQTGTLSKSVRMLRNPYTPDKPYTEFPIATLPDLETAVRRDGKNAQREKLKALFEDGVFPGSSLAGAQNRYTWFAKANTAFEQTAPPDGIPNDYSVEFPNEDASEGTVVEGYTVPDDQMYMPFYFQDLRDDPPKFLYFRAFLKEGLQETFTPSWQVENYYGRVDEVPTYQSTQRSISLAFDVVAFNPNDLMVMWTKLHKLQSMVYPLYDTSGFIKSGPLIRMRVGDLICGARNGSKVKKGLPGYINSLDFSYDDGIWNVATDLKVPRKVSVSIGFTVIHDGNPGVYPFLKRSFDVASDQDRGEREGAIRNNFGAMTLTNDTVNGANTTTMTVSPGDIRGITETVLSPNLIT